MAIEHEGQWGPFAYAGAPVAGTDSIQTITFGSGITGGTFKLKWDGWTTGAITWSATNNTLIANVDAALGALPNVVSASNVTSADGNLSSGIGTMTVTFVAALGKRAIALMTVADNSLTGTTHVVSVADTTPGVDATFRGCAIGTVVTDTTNGKAYINTGTAAAPTWTVVGSQS